jgi:hypothetical protein
MLRERIGGRRAGTVGFRPPVGLVVERLDGSSVLGDPRLPARPEPAATCSCGSDRADGHVLRAERPRQDGSSALINPDVAA